MSVLISGVLMNPAGVPVSGAEVTFSALTNGPSVLNGFSASVMTDQDGNYSIPLEICEYAISIQSDGYNSVYGSVSINEKSTPATINELLKLAAMEQAVTPAIIVYFREIQTDVAAKLATMQTLSNNATAAARDAIASRNEAAQYAQSLSAAVAQAQQASTSATASANMATQSANKADSAKNAAEAAAGNAQATLTDVMKKSANGADIADAAQFRNNVGLKNAATHDVQTSATDATAGLVLKIANNGEGPFGLGSRGTILNTTDVVVQLRSAVNGWYRCAVNTVRAPSTGAWTFLVMKWDDNTRCVIAISAVTGQGVQFITIGASSDSGWTPLWGANNLSNPATLNTEQIFTGIKFLQAGSEPLRLAAPSSGAAAYLSIYDVNRTTRKGWFGRGSANDTIQMQNDVTGAGVTLSQDGNINLSSPNGIVNWNGQQVLMSGNAQTISGAKTFSGAQTFTSTPRFFANNAGFNCETSAMSETTVGRWVQFVADGTQFLKYYIRAGNGGVPDVTNQRIIQIPKTSSGIVLVTGNNVVTDSGGFYKAASPVINIYSDGSFTTTDEADGVNVERLSEGVYKITGCLGLNADRAWGGDEGGVDVPMCRNKLPRLWVDYGGDDGSSRINADGSIVIRTYHRPHPDAPVFARNEIDGYTDGAPIDIPSDTFISVRVQMPSREELKPQVMHSNVYSGTVSIAGAISQ